MRKHPPLRIVLRVSTSVVGGLWGLAMPPNIALGPLTCLEVWRKVQTPGAWLQSVTPFMDGAAADTWKGETSASGRRRGNLVVGRPRTLFWSLPMG